MKNTTKKLNSGTLKNRRILNIIRDREKLIFILIVSFALIIIDQIAKLALASVFEFSESVKIFSFLHITLVYNYGAAFGILQNFTFALIWISIIVIGIIFYYFDRIPRIKSFMILTALVLGGTISNLIDRIRLGYVIDFIDFRIWPAFNIADAAITIGVIGLILYLINKKK